MENAKKFFEEVARTEEAKAFFKATKAPETEEARIAAYIEIAKKLGVELTADGIKEYFASSDKTSAELDDEELSQLVGGGDNEACKYSFQNEENCFAFDGCDKFYRTYDGYVCRSNDVGALEYSGPQYDLVYKMYNARCSTLAVVQEYRKIMKK